MATLVAGIFGWIAIRLLAGQRLLEAFKVKDITPLIAVVAGMLLISLLGAIPFLGPIVVDVAGYLGLAL